MCDPRELEQLCRTDFEFLFETPLHRTSKRHPSLSLSVQVRRVCCEVGDGKFLAWRHGSHVTPDVCAVLQVPHGDVGM